MDSRMKLIRPSSCGKVQTFKDSPNLFIRFQMLCVWNNKGNRFVIKWAHNLALTQIDGWIKGGQINDDYVILMVASHFVPRSFRTYFGHFLHTFGHFVPRNNHSYPGHFVPILVISYLGKLSTKWLYGGQFVPKSFRTLFGHFVPIFVISYPAKMDGLQNGRTSVFWLKWQINS